MDGDGGGSSAGAGARQATNAFSRACLQVAAQNASRAACAQGNGLGMPIAPDCLLSIPGLSEGLGPLAVPPALVGLLLKGQASATLCACEK